jgi:hypothetical protein
MVGAESPYIVHSLGLGTLTRGCSAISLCDYWVVLCDDGILLNALLLWLGVVRHIGWQL